jgi:signal transduction histidine kinase
LKAQDILSSNIKYDPEIMIEDKILVIDDEESIVQSIYRGIMIEDEDYDLYSAYNGADGLELYYQVNPLLVILDLNMPVMGGIEFLKNIKITSHDPCSVIVMTGQSDDTYIKTCFNLGVSAFLRKPFNEYEFIGLVKHFIELKHIQAALKEEISYREQTQKDLNDQREKFISVLLHDLKNPLIPIAYYSKKILDGKIPSEEVKMAKIEVMHQSSEDLLTIITNTSNALRQKSLLETFNPEMVDLKKIIIRVMNNFLYVLEDNKINIHFNEKREDRWHEIGNYNIEADRRQIKTMIENLLSNAIKYVKSSIEINVTETDGVIRLTVSNDGPGIDAMYHEKIFEDYFQPPNSKDGSGLGLFSVKKVVENHKGSIVVRSSPGNGTSFEVSFPSHQLSSTF